MCAKNQYHTILLLFILSATFLCGRTHADTSAVFNPDLIILKTPARADTADADSSAPRPRRIVADSARIIAPEIRTVITADTVSYEIEPRLPVDSVTLIVYHSQDLADTLGVISSPPFRAVWNCASVQSQDQTNLQFGYILYCPYGLTIISPPKPHRWALDRGIKPSKKVYHIKQRLRAGEFEINGDMSKWSDVKGADIENVAHFKLQWIGAKLYFIVQVRDSSITFGDFVELHFDTNRERGHFSGVNQRSMRFSPRSGRHSFTVELTDSGFALADSINAPIKEETEWSVATDTAGYTIEASIPLALLFGLGFPPAKVGFDVSVMNVDRVVANPRSKQSNIDSAGDDINSGGIAFGKIETVTSFYSWSGASRFSKFSPRGWGTARISQAVPMLNFMMIFVIAASCLTPIFFIVNLILSRRGKNDCDPEDAFDLDPLMETITECVDNRLHDANFGIKDVLKSTNTTEDEIISLIKRNLDCTFDQLLSFRRIKRSQVLMKDESLAIDDISGRCGFKNVDEYREKFKERMNVDPEVSREALLERIREDKAAEEEDD
jgi:AraC-like DNA-binding protein